MVVDLIRPTLGWVDQKVLARAVRLPFPGLPKGIPVVTAEDLILLKLIFFRRNENHDDLRDIDSILRRQGRSLDVGYIVGTTRQLFKEGEPKLAWLLDALRRHGLEAGGQE